MSWGSGQRLAIPLDLSGADAAVPILGVGDNYHIIAADGPVDVVIDGLSGQAVRHEPQTGREAQPDPETGRRSTFRQLELRNAHSAGQIVYLWVGLGVTWGDRRTTVGGDLQVVNGTTNLQVHPQGPNTPRNTPDKIVPPATNTSLWAVGGTSGAPALIRVTNIGANVARVTSTTAAANQGTPVYPGETYCEYSDVPVNAYSTLGTTFAISGTWRS